MKQYNKIIMKIKLFIILFFIYSLVNAQVNLLELKKDIINYDNFLNSKAKKKTLNSYNDSVKEIIVYPSVSIDYNYNELRKTISFKIDSFLSNCLVISYNNKIKLDTNYFFVSNNSFFQNTYDINWLDMINIAKKKTEYIFFLVPFYFNLYTEPIIGYFYDNNKIEFIDHHLNTYKSIDDLLKYRYGSYDAFVNDVENILFRKSYLSKYDSLSLKESIMFYKKEPRNYIRHKIFNPDSLTKASISKIKEFCKLTEYQKIEIIDRIKNFIVEFNEVNLDYMDLFNILIKDVLRKTITYNQLKNYFVHIDLFYYIEKKSESIINQYYYDVFLKNENKNISKENFYLEYVFGNKEIEDADSLYISLEKIHIGNVRKYPKWK